MKTEPNDPKIEKMLDQLRAVPERNRLAAVQARGRFLAQAASLRNTRPIPQPKRGLEFLFSPAGFYRKEKMVVLATFLLVLAVLFSGTGMTAYAAQGSLPGETLYPVKTFVEDVRLNLTTDPDARYELLDQYVNRRFAELDELHATGTPVNMAYVNRLLQELDQMLQMAANQPDADMMETLDGLHVRIQDRDYLDDVETEGEYKGESEYSRLQVEIANRHQVILNAITDPGSFKEQWKYRQDGAIVPAEGHNNGADNPGPGGPGGTGNGAGTGTGLTGTPQPNYSFPDSGGMGTGQEGKP